MVAPVRHRQTIFYCHSPILTDRFPATIDSHRSVAMISLRECEMKKMRVEAAGFDDGYSHA